MSLQQVLIKVKHILCKAFNNILKKLKELNNIENQRPLPNDPTKTNNDTFNKTI